MRRSPSPRPSLGERETRFPLGKETCDGMGESRFQVPRRPQNAFSPREKARMRGKAASNSQAAICFLRTHCLAFTHYKRRGTAFVDFRTNSDGGRLHAVRTQQFGNGILIEGRILEGQRPQTVAAIAQDAGQIAAEDFFAARFQENGDDLRRLQAGRRRAGFRGQIAGHFDHNRAVGEPPPRATRRCRCAAPTPPARPRPGLAARRVFLITPSISASNAAA